VYAKDGGLPPNVAKVTVKIRVTDENDCAPVFGRLYYSIEVPENAEPSYLFTLRATDQDTAERGEINYKLTGERGEINYKLTGEGGEEINYKLTGEGGEINYKLTGEGGRTNRTDRISLAYHLHYANIPESSVCCCINRLTCPASPP